MKKKIVLVLLLPILALVPESTMALSRVEKKCVVMNMVSNPKQEKILSFYEGKVKCSGDIDKKKVKKEYRQNKREKIGNITARRFYWQFGKKEKKYKNILLNRCVVMEMSDIYQSGGAETGVSAKDTAVKNCYQFASSDEDFLAIQKDWMSRRNDKSATTGNTLREDYKTTEKYFK